MRQEKTRLVADRYGYVYASGKVLQVLSPLWVSADGMQVRFLQFRQLRAPAGVDRGSLQQMLSEVGAVADLDDEAVEQLPAGQSPATGQSVLLRIGCLLYTADTASKAIRCIHVGCRTNKKKKLIYA